MPEVTSHAPGFFCFAELAAADRKAASDFYGELFGWETVGVPPVPEAGYFLLKLGGKDVAGMYELSPNQREGGALPSWLVYVSVASADESAAKAKRLGATLIAEPFDVPGIGRMALVKDPQGARFALWQAQGHNGYVRVADPGCVCWNELETTDSKAATAFYSALFGWIPETKAMGTSSYTEWRRGKSVVAGMIQMTEEWDGVPPRWMTYFAVADCDLSAQLAEDLGGSVCIPPSDIPNVGRFAVIDDPGGATFSIFTPRLTA